MICRATLERATAKADYENSLTCGDICTCVSCTYKRVLIAMSLHVYVPANSHIEILTPEVKVLKGNLLWKTIRS